MKKLAAFVALVSLSGVLQAQNLVQLLENKNFAGAEALLKSGVDANQKSSDGTTALHWAAYYGNAELVKSLLRAEADPATHNDYGSSPMMEAATVGNTELIKLLLDAGVDAESANPEGQTALMAVARTGNLDAAELLIKAGANVDAATRDRLRKLLHLEAVRAHPNLGAAHH